jgi:predicted glycosyltransferase
MSESITPGPTIVDKKPIGWLMLEVLPRLSLTKRHREEWKNMVSR